MQRANVLENAARLNERIRTACEKSGRDPASVKVVAVTKYVSNDTAKQAIEAGVNHLGENRVEGARDKTAAIGDHAIWHFIGSLQSKKAKHIVESFSYIHSLERMSLAKELQKRLKGKTPIKCFIQVNVSGEESKSGLKPEETIAFIEALAPYSAIEVVGLMTMAPYEEDPERTRLVFKRLRVLRDEIAAKNWHHAPCTELSMGMSNDFEVAIEEGATFIRIGTMLVGNEHTS
ncbi:YggS family pyridoxal phosphate-dependent enzyme [Bacillus sp. JCM 19041]|uniref:YggS family pyridoxal phosphate-dependent enzyme n=1 Tax=Bacillus sp. JCM 19041 TaxID=1460637 RepID=UPI0006D13776